MSTSEVLRHKALKLLKRLKIPFDAACSADWYNGRQISAGPDQSLSNVLHDAAHWILAGESRRSVVNFGCGPDPGYCTPKGIESPVLADPFEEVFASALGIALLLRAGASKEDAMNVFDDHSWGPRSGSVKKRKVEFKESLGQINTSFSQAESLGFKMPKSVQGATRKAFRDFWSWSLYND